MNADWKPIYNEKLRMKKNLIRLRAVNNTILFNAHMTNNFLIKNGYTCCIVANTIDENNNIILGFNFLKEQVNGSFSILYNGNKKNDTTKLQTKNVFTTLIDLGLTRELNAYFNVIIDGEVCYINVNKPLKLKQVAAFDMSHTQKINKLHKRKSKRVEKKLEQ